MPVSVTLYNGANTIGGNKILLHLIHMGLLPPLRGIYRTDPENRGAAWRWTGT